MRVSRFLAVMVLPLVALSSGVFAQESGGGKGALVAGVVSEHILPRFASLREETAALDAAAQADCAPRSAPLRAAYHRAFDAWIGVSHLRFGPSEEDHRAFALAFWPDPRAKTPKILRRILSDELKLEEAAASFEEVSIAARGFYALELMLYDPAFAPAKGESAEVAAGRCLLVRLIAHDIARNGAAIDADWQGYQHRLMAPGPDGVYRSDDEAVQELFKALLAGLEFTAHARLDRPLGSFERPRPLRAEARRSQRSRRNLRLSLEALRELAGLLSPDPALLEPVFASALQDVAKVREPDFAGIGAVQGRFRLEVVRQNVGLLHDLARVELGPLLGVGEGFNALDGD